MMTLMRKNIHTWGYGKALTLFIGCFIFSISERVNGTLSFEQHILSAVSDHYYLTYFLLPVLLLSVFPFIEDDSELVIFRFDSYYSYFSKKWFCTGLIAVILIFIQALTIILSGIGLPLNNQWIVIGNTTSAELFGVLQQYISSPLQAFILYLSYQFLGIWIIFGICIWIGHFVERKWTTRILVVLYVFAGVWIKIPILQSLPFTGLNHLFILHHNIHSIQRFTITGVTVIMLVATILISARVFWRGYHLSFSRKRPSITPYYIRELTTRKNLFILCTAVIIAILYKKFSNPYIVSDEEWIYFLFAGHGTRYFQILPFLEMLIVIGTPLYLLAVFMEQALSCQSSFISIRINGRKKLLSGILSASMQFLALYTLIWLLGTAISTYLFGYGISITSGKMLLYGVGTKYLDTLLQCLVMLAIYILCKQVTIGFLVVIGGNLLCILPLSVAAYLPFGLSCMARIALDAKIGIAASTAIGILITFIALVLGWLLKYGYRKLLN